MEIPAYYFTCAAYALPPGFTLGNVGKKTVFGPGSQNWDFSMLKNTSITEKLNKQFCAEFFNVLNHSNFALLGRTINQPMFGVITGAGSARAVQFGLKLIL